MKIIGTAGHGSLLLENTAGEKLHRILGKYLEFRNSQIQKLNDNPHLTIGDVTTVNLTVINGGQQINVVPPLITISFDMRIALVMPYDQMDAEILSWIEAAGDGVELNFLTRDEKIPPSPIDGIYADAIMKTIVYQSVLTFFCY